MAPQNLRDLIHEVLATESQTDRADTLLSVLRKYRFWPALQMKKFFDKSGLVLLHNTYKRIDVDDFKELYDECRSVVLDLNAPEGENIVVTLAHEIPERMTADQYKAVKSDDDKLSLSYEGTVVHVYEHRGKWYFGTSGCPSVDSSRYFHPNKTHGMMLDEALAKYFPSDTYEGMSPREKSQAVRDAFAANLHIAKSYSFILVHHENRHIMEYSPVFGEGYAVLVHIATRNRITQEEEDLSSKPLETVGVRYADTIDADVVFYKLTDPLVYGVMVLNKDNKLIKVSSDRIVQHEECDLGNPNKWQNMLWVYLQNKPHYHISDYIAEYAPDLENPKDSLGREMAPTYIIHTVICTMRDILYTLYTSTTSYNPAFGKFRMNRQVDYALPPILRFHLAQLRGFQVSGHSHAYITPKAVYHYICHHQTLKNIRTLINFFATTGGHDMKYRQAECFGVLNQLLTE